MMRCWILQRLGAGVLHNRSVEMAKKYGVPLVVRSSLNNSEGTVVKEDPAVLLWSYVVERMLISGVAGTHRFMRRKTLPSFLLLEQV